MATAISFVHSVVHEDRVLADGVQQGAFGLSPAFETTPLVLVAARGAGVGYGDLWVAASPVTPNSYGLERGDDGGAVTVRVQAVNWNVGRQP